MYSSGEVVRVPDAPGSSLPANRHFNRSGVTRSLSCIAKKKNGMLQQPCARKLLLRPIRAVADLESAFGSMDEEDPHKVVVKKKDLTEGTLYIGMEANANATVPGNGGLRVRSYSNPSAAENEVVNLTDAMRKKHRMYNTGFAGAKLVFDSKVAPELLDKKLLMREVSRFLASMNGTVYTGCDLNTTDEDMAYLDELSPFVLAAIGATVDANIATADGTFAAVVRTAEEMGLPKNFKIFVQGCGKVGSRLARSLVDYGADVYVADVKKELADIPGATNVSGIGATEWHKLNIDIFSPCAIAGIVTEEAANLTSAKAIIGAANVPFADQAARLAAAENGIIFVPEYITSAGAIIVDSLEKCTGALPDVQPSVAYKFVYDMVYAKAGEYLNEINEAGSTNSADVTASWDEATTTVTEPLNSTAVGDKLGPWMDANTVDVDVVIIGGGMAGTAAAYSLSQRCPKATGVVLEAGPQTAHKGGSSYGESRMFRQMYSDKYFSDLQTQALEYWRDIEEKSGVQLLSENGLLFYGSPDTGETVEGSIPGCIEVMKDRGLPHKEFNEVAELKAEFDGIDPSSGYIGVMEETAGSVNSSLACEVMMQQAIDSGKWKLAVDTKCDDIWQSQDDGKYNVMTSTGVIYRAERVVLAAGAWTNNLLGHLGYEMDSQVWKVHWGHYKMKNDAQSPQWFHFGADDGLYYGFPGDKPGGIAKVGVDFSLEEDRMNSMEDFNYEPNEEVVKMIDNFVKEQWGGVYEERVEMLASPYTMTKDSMFVLDTLPNHPGVSVFSAGNGRAFKFAPVLGDALAALVKGEAPPFDISPMAIDRPGLLKKQPPADAVSPAVSQGPAFSSKSEGGAAGSARAVVGAMSVEDASSEEDIDAFGRAHVPYGEVGAAFYSKLTLGCFDVVYKSKDLIVQSIDALDIKEGQAVRIADFGSADGGPMMPMVQAVRAAVPKTSDVEIVFEDQENNDFTSLFYLAKGIEALPSGVEGNTTPLAETDGVFYTACGRTFFQQCLPKASVDLCTSYTAMHWLSKLPVHLSDGVHHTVSQDRAGLDAFAAQAAKDWENILTQRSKELKTGGQMVIACFGVDVEGRCLGWSNDGNAKMYEEMTQHWAAMRDEGLITEVEYASATFPNYYRTEEELKAPFADETLGLKLKSIEWRYSPCPFGRSLGSPAEVIGTMRTWSNSTFTSALSDARSEDEKKSIVDEFYNRYERTIAADPSRHHMDYVHAYIHAERV